MKKSFLVRFFKKALLPSCVLLTAAAAPQVSVTGAWARASLPHQNASVAYMVLRSTAADALTGASSPEAGSAMLHQSTHAGGMAGMADMDSVALPSGSDVALAPGGAHIMLMNLPHALRAGEMLHLTLHFAHAADQTVSVPVRAVDAVAP